MFRGCQLKLRHQPSDTIKKDLRKKTKTMDNTDSTRSVSRRIYDVIGRKLRRWQVLFIAQIIIIYMVIICCLINLSLDNGKTELWVSLLSYSLGCMLPTPKIKKTEMS